VEEYTVNGILYFIFGGLVTLCVAMYWFNKRLDCIRSRYKICKEKLYELDAYISEIEDIHKPTIEIFNSDMEEAKELDEVYNNGQSESAGVRISA
jgi:hypothetical protein